MANLHRFVSQSRHPLARLGKRAYRRVRGFALPAPRAVVRPALWAFITARSAYYFGLRVLVCEPLFKAYCTRYGRGLRTGAFVHWVSGSGVIDLGDDVWVDGKSAFTFSTHYSPSPTLRVGSHTFIGHGCSFAVGRSVTIGRHCMLAGGVKLFEFSGHPTDPADRLAGLPTPPEKVRPITVEDNAWLGTDCMILPGVTVGEGSVVAAGSVVRVDVPPYTVVAGNPAQPVASLRRPAAAAAGT